MKKDAFVIGFFLGAGIVLGSKGAEKLISAIPVGIKYLKGFKKPEKKDEFEEVK